MGFRIGKYAVLPLMVLLLSLVIACNKTYVKEDSSTVKSSGNEDSLSNSSVRTGKIKIVATVLPVYLFTKSVAGNVANVEILVRPGTEIHEYQATPENIKAIATANVLVKNGLGLEEFLEGTVKNAQNPKLLEIDASQGIKALEVISPVIKTAKEDKNHDHEIGNPHIWLDPVLAKQQILNIRDGLITADPGNKRAYQANAAAYLQKLENLNNEFQQSLQKTPNCTFITFHDAFPYLAKRYHLQQVAVVQIPEDQLSPSDIQKAINAVKKYQVKALFSEPGVDNKLIKSLSEDLKLNLRILNSLENGETEPEYYFQAMKANLKTLSDACK